MRRTGTAMGTATGAARVSLALRASRDQNLPSDSAKGLTSTCQTQDALAGPLASVYRTGKDACVFVSTFFR